MSDIVKRLRGVTSPLAGEAADKIERMRSEIERLRAIIEGDEVGSIKRAYADGYALAQREIERLKGDRR